MLLPRSRLRGRLRNVEDPSEQLTVGLSMPGPVWQIGFLLAKALKSGGRRLAAPIHDEHGNCYGQTCPSCSRTLTRLSDEAPRVHRDDRRCGGGVACRCS
jgi:hypothetical protein